MSVKSIYLFFAFVCVSKVKITLKYFLKSAHVILLMLKVIKKCVTQTQLIQYMKHINTNTS